MIIVPGAGGRLVPAIDLCLLITFAQCIPDDQDQLIKKYKLQCVDETRVNPELVIMLKAGNWDINDIPLKKWALCVLVHTKIMSENGVFRIDEALSDVPERDHDFVMDRINRCLPIKTFVPYEIAWHYLKCYNQRMPRQFNIVSTNREIDNVKEVKKYKATKVVHLYMPLSLALP